MVPLLFLIASGSTVKVSGMPASPCSMVVLVEALAHQDSLAMVVAVMLIKAITVETVQIVLVFIQQAVEVVLLQ